MGLGFGALVCYGLGLKIVEELWGLLFGRLLSMHRLPLQMSQKFLANPGAGAGSCEPYVDPKRCKPPKLTPNSTPDSWPQTQSPSGAHT